MTKIAKLTNLLVDRQLELTEGEIATRLNTTGDSVRSMISQLRRQGHAVYLNEGTKDTRGRVRASRYRVGTPTKAMVAAYYTLVGAR